MRTVYDQRRDNLRALIKQWGGPNPTREIEGKLGLPLGWLDAEHGEARPLDDDEVLSTRVRALAATLRDMGHKATPDQMADLVALAYEHVKLTGRVDEIFIQRIVRLTKS